MVIFNQLSGLVEEDPAATNATAKSKGEAYILTMHRRFFVAEHSTAQAAAIHSEALAELLPRLWGRQERGTRSLPG